MHKSTTIKHLVAIAIALLFSLQNSLGQDNIYKAISDAEKTVFTTTTYNRGGGVIGKSAGFFIGSSGLAIVRASIFVGADSIKIIDSRNLQLKVERVVAVHQPSDLAMVKIISDRKSNFNFLFPSSSIFTENEELLIFSEPELGEDGVQIEKINQILEKLVLNRLGILKTNMGYNSTASPAINSKGELVGITGYLKPETPSFLYSCAILSDTNWVNLNVPTKKLKESVLKQAYMAPHLSKGLLSYAFQDWIGAAKNFTSYLAVFNNSALGFAFRGYARYMYNNKEESKRDFAAARLLSSTSLYAFYFEALIAIQEGKKEKAYKLIDSSVYYQFRFPQARVLRGNLTLETNRPHNDALLDYSYAIQVDNNYAEGYYYRAQYLRKYTKNFDLAYSDMGKCIILNPSLPNAYIIKGEMDIEHENFFEAQKNMNNAVRKDPDNAEALFTRGLVNYHLGLKRDACNDWKKSSDLGNEKALSYLLRFCKSEQLAKSIYE